MAAMAAKKPPGKKLSVQESKLEDDKILANFRLSVQESKLEDDKNMANFRAELEGTPYRDLQAMAKEFGVAANLKTSMLIDGIIYSDMEFNGSDLSTRTYDCAAYMESMEAVRLLVKKSGANCILDCAKKVKAELFAALTAAGEPVVTDGKPAVDVKANIQGNANGKKAKEVVPPPKPLANAVILPPPTPMAPKPLVNAVILPPPKALASAVYAPIHVGGLLRTMKDVDLQNLLDTKAVIGRFYRKRFGKVIGFAKVLIPIDGIDKVLNQEFSLSGVKLRLAKWVESPSARPAHASPAAGKRRSGRRTSSRKIPSAAIASVGLIKEQASFISNFLAAPQARPPSGGPHSRHGERLYSQIVAAVKTVDVRTKFLETTMREVSRLLELVQLQTR